MSPFSIFTEELRHLQSLAPRVRSFLTWVRYEFDSKHQSLWPLHILESVVNSNSTELPTIFVSLEVSHPSTNKSSFNKQVIFTQTILVLFDYILTSLSRSKFLNQSKFPSQSKFLSRDRIFWVDQNFWVDRNFWGYQILWVYQHFWVDRNFWVVRKFRVDRKFSLTSVWSFWAWMDRTRSNSD